MKWKNPFAKKTVARAPRDINEVIRDVDKQIGHAVTRLADT